MGNRNSRFGGLNMARYELPKGHSCLSFTMRELTGRDEIEAGRLALATASEADRDNAVMLNFAEQREMMRLSLVEVDGEPVGIDTPFMDMDDWSMKTMVFVRKAFNEMNRVDGDDLKNFVGLPAMAAAVEAGLRTKLAAKAEDHDDD